MTSSLNADWSWRIPSLLQAVASVFQICLIYFCPESPRWLVENGKPDQAIAILTKYHANGDVNDPLVEVEMIEIQQAIEVDRELRETSSYWSMIKDKANRSRTLIIIAIGFFSQWSGNGLISYYLSIILTSIGYTDSKQQLMINGIIQAVSLVTAIIGAMVVNRFARRTLWLTSTIGLLISFIGESLLAVLSDVQCGPSARRFTTLRKTSRPVERSSLLSSSTTPSSTSVGPLCRSSTVSRFFPLPFELEDWPFTTSPSPWQGLSTSTSTLSDSKTSVGNVSYFLHPVPEPLLITVYIVYDVWIAFELVIVYFFFKETRGMSLEETAAIFDGAEAVHAIAIKGESVAHDVSPVYESKEQATGERVTAVLSDK